MQILGGWAKKDSVGIVAIASRSGRIFCFAREHPPGSAFAQIEAQEIQDAGFSNLATVGGQTLAVIITGLSPEIQYQITCVAEADGGLLSVQDQIDSTRRLLNTSSTEVAVSANTGPAVARSEAAELEVKGKFVELLTPRRRLDLGRSGARS